ncbi:MAG: hypothetical protein PUJ82_09725 [Spirochaetales bacterium]|nr:hypothetical protein [Spirochaetales bacterium]MDY5914243.1 hypothetical protein [Treponema sp.]
MGDVIEILKKNVIETLFDTVGVVEWSYGKFGEFVVEWMGKLANGNKV